MSQLLKTDEIESRAYQEVIAASALGENTLVVLPTGLGKTVIAAMVAAKKAEDGKVLFLAPTKPLVDQHIDTFDEFIDVDREEMYVMTGDTRPDKRYELWEEKRIFFATPQVVENDLIANEIPTEEFSLTIFDEAHRATGEYSYVFINQKMGCHKMALTASPGGSKEKIMEVADNLDMTNFEVRTEDDPDVEPYIQKKDVNWTHVSLDDRFEDAKKNLEKGYRDQLKELKKLGQISSINNVHKGDLLKARGKISSQLSNSDDPELYSAISRVATALKIQQALELLETQGISQCYSYIEKLKDDDSKAAGRALNNDNIQKAKSMIEYLKKNGEEHPKLDKLRDIIGEMDDDEKALVFTQYRDSTEKIAEELNTEGLNAVKFIGQQGEKGMSQTKQAEVLQAFEDGKFNVVVSTSLHPRENIIMKSPEGEIKVRSIGDYIDNLATVKGETSEIVEADWKVFTTDGENTFFKPITEIHRHRRKNKVLRSSQRTAGDFLVTENHSIFSFNANGQHIADKPEEGKFVNLAWEAPNTEETEEIDLAKLLHRELPNGKKDMFFFSFKNIDQPKIREINSETKFLNSLEKKSFVKKISEEANLDPKTVTEVRKRLAERNIVSSKVDARKKFVQLTEKGEQYKEFLNWFQSEQEYYKGKYRIDLETVAESPEYYRKFCSLNLEISYGKSKVPRFLSTEEVAKFLGYFVSEGHVRNREKGGELLLTREPEDEIKQKMHESIKEGLSMKTSVRKPGVLISSRIPYYLIKHVFKCGISTDEKQVPPVIFSGSEEAKWNFLEAYFEGDGYSDNGRITLTTISRKLATGIHFLLRQLGIKKIAIRREKRNKNNHSDIYRIKIHESLPFKQIDKKDGHSTYYDVVPEAIDDKSVYNEIGNSFGNIRGGCRKKQKPVQRTCFDYIEKNQEIDEQPDYVYDISVEETERFFGGTSLACLHNSIGEEGLDIPAVDYVIFYEPVPSGIRDIQRAGRTGRQEEGTVYVLIAEDTRDEGHFWSAHHKKKNMNKVLNELKNEDTMTEQNKGGQKTLDGFKKSEDEDDDIVVIADDRENAVAKKLSKMDITVRKNRLDVADFLLSERTAVERKSASDFVDSLVDQRLFEQMPDLQQFENPVIMIEGDDLYSHRQIHPNAIRGALASIAIDHGIPILWTEDEEDTAEMLKTLAKREQEENDRTVSIRGTKSVKSEAELQQFVVAGLPDVNTKLAERLLEKFGSIQEVFTASNSELMKVEGIGEKTADNIRSLIQRDYKEE